MTARRCTYGACESPAFGTILREQIKAIDGKPKPLFDVVLCKEHIASMLEGPPTEQEEDLVHAGWLEMDDPSWPELGRFIELGRVGRQAGMGDPPPNVFPVYIRRSEIDER